MKPLPRNSAASHYRPNYFRFKRSKWVVEPPSTRSTASADNTREASDRRKLCVELVWRLPVPDPVKEPPCSRTGSGSPLAHDARMLPRQITTKTRGSNLIILRNLSSPFRNAAVFLTGRDMRASGSFKADFLAVPKCRLGRVNGLKNKSANTFRSR